MTSEGFFGDLVTDPNGVGLGTLSEVWVDLVTGKIAYALISSGGFMGKGEYLYPVPWSALARDSDSHAFLLRTDKTLLSEAPSIAVSELHSGMSATIREAVDTYYRAD